MTYGNADLTLVAGRSDDYRKGFLKTTFVPKVLPAQLTVQDPDNQAAIKCWFSLPRSRAIGITDTRGWCFQEALLSRRMLMFGEEQLSFRCRENHCFEDGHLVPIEVDFWYDASMRSRGGYKVALPRTFRGMQIIDSWKEHLDIYLRWYLLTEEFSAHHFYDPADNHAALSGTVLLFQEALSLAFGHSRYIAGLWERQMITGLLWEVDPESPSALPVRKDQNGVQISFNRAPSWSWMSLVAHVFQPAAHEVYLGQDCSSPAAPDGKTWGPNLDGWGPLMIKQEDFPPLFRLEVKAFVRKVRISQDRLPDQENSRLAKLLTDPQNASVTYGQNIGNTLKRRREADEEDDEEAPSSIASDEEFAAQGFFDMSSTITSPPATGIHAMRLTSARGLLLEQVPDPGYKSVAYKRLGTFIIKNPWSFYPPESFRKESAGNPRLLLQPFDWDYNFSEDHVPKSNLVLV